MAASFLGGFKRMKKCLIISGGDYTPIKGVKKNDFVIACDRGYEYAKRDGITPMLIVGDFDSYSGNLPEDIRTIHLPCQKDDTDTMYAIKYAIEHGFKEIAIHCALGGRLDHTYANIQSAVYAAERGIKISIVDENSHILFLHNSQIHIERQYNCSLSVFAASDHCSGVCINGTKYTLENGQLTNSFPLGISNEWEADTAEICVQQGTLIIILSKLPKNN